MLKNLKLGLKMTLGFGLVILLVIFVGGLATINMMQIQGDSVALNEKYIPEVTVAADVQVASLETMYAMRGYTYSYDLELYNEMSENLAGLDKFIAEARNLAEEQNLPALAEAANQAAREAAAYRELTVKSKNAVDRLLVARDQAALAGNLFIEEFSAFLNSMEDAFKSEIASGSSTTVLEERLYKITFGNELLDRGNFIRQENLRAQAYRDPAIIEAAMSNFDFIERGIQEILRVLRRDVNIRQMNTIQGATENYRKQMAEVVAALRLLEDLGIQRGEVAARVLSAAAGVLKLGVNNSTEIAQEAVERVSASITAIIIGIAAALLIALVVAIILTRGITVPVSKGVAFAQAIALGDLQVGLEVEQRDEIGVLAKAMKEMQQALQYKAGLVEKVADGDLTIDVKVASEKDGLGMSLVKMVESLNDLLGQVNSAVDQVSAGSDQVSQASQSLSQGATEQASSLEEISSSANQINSQSKQNADNATEANALAKKAESDATAGNQQMKELVTAMERINSSSDEINKVVKVIDDIAFQINLLALNANVEAARAGKYGKGFAVVAEEVRNLAVRAAAAVKETSKMVEDSISNIKTGNGLVDITAKQLGDIVDGAGKVANFLEEIATASREQAQAIDQITSGLDQIDQVTQANTASAEESASASEELASQAQQLQAMIARFKLKSDTRMEMRYLSDHRTSVGYGDRTVKVQSSVDSRPGQKPRTVAPATKGKGTPKKEPTGIRPVDPAKVIRLDDDDFERF